MNLVEKLVQRAVVTGKGGVSAVRAGSFVSVRPSHVLTHDNTSPVIDKFRSIGSAGVSNPRQPVFVLDHNVQDKSEANLRKYDAIGKFAADNGVDFYPAGRGIGHQVMVEEGYAFPGTFVVGSDSHSNMYGGVGCLGTPVVRTDAAAIWATERTWWQVPPVAQVRLDGVLRPGVTGKDVVITLCGFFNNDDVLNHAVEFAGDGVASLSVDERLTIANMTTEWGALAGVFPIDSVTLEWLRGRRDRLGRRADRKGAHPRINDATVGELERDVPAADPDARYAKVLSLDLSKVEPHVSGPNHVKTMSSVRDLEQRRIKVDKAYIVSCVNSRVEDLAAAADILRGRRVAPSVELYVAAASAEVQKDSKDAGAWGALMEAGAIPLPPGCGPCIGLGKGLLEDGEVGISATNRNFKGRMGSRDAEAYLASPTVVAASAAAGYICGPDGLAESVMGGDAAAAVGRVEQEQKGRAGEDEGRGDLPGLVTGFPQSVGAPVVFCDADNVNTDGIYAGKYTYQDGMTPEEMGTVAMDNYDPEFNSFYRRGDLLVAGYNFGTGSSREQAATALKYKGVPLVIAGSYSATYVRNAFNNGYLCLESPGLVDCLRQQAENAASEAPTARPEKTTATVCFQTWTVELKQPSGAARFDVSPVGEAAQELVVAGGLEAWVAAQAAAPSQD